MGNQRALEHRLHVPQDTLLSLVDERRWHTGIRRARQPIEEHKRFVARKSHGHALLARAGHFCPDVA